MAMQEWELEGELEGEYEGELEGEFEGELEGEEFLSSLRSLAGRAAGALTLLLDAGKAALPMLVAYPLLARAGASPAAAEAWRSAVGLAAFAGHLWPIWLRFQGGKGVATALGVFLVLAPMPALLGVAAFALAFAASRIPAVGSLAGVAVCTAGTFMVHGLASPVSGAALVTALLVVWRHRGNIRRLARGTENRV